MPLVTTLVPDGAEIKARRLELGLSPVELGKKIRRHSQTIRRIETGRQPVASELLMHQLARALGATVEDITKAAHASAA
jgi:DNA-binding XRE family transcriptional regulator